MVFAPKETASSIGWETRSDADSIHSKSEKDFSDEAPKKKNGKRWNKEQKRKAKRSISETCEKPAGSKKRAMGLPVDEVSVTENKSIVGDHQVQTADHSYYGPVVPHSTAAIGLPPGVTTQQLKTDDSSISTIVIFDGQGNPKSQRIAINGRARIHAIEGSFDILGYHLSSTSGDAVIVESPGWMSALCIEPLHQPHTHSQETKGLDTHKTTSIQISSLSKDFCSFELVTPQETRSITITDRWKSIATEIIKNGKDEVGKSQKILVCGAKGVGKSTYVRYLTNRLLSSSGLESKELEHHKKVVILDCDVGQPEFSAPGMVTLTVASNPILSPPHAHIVCGKKDMFTATEKHEKACFYGFTTSKANPVRYMSAVRCLLKKYDELCDEEGFALPLIINTDGWVKGMGYEILSNIVDVGNPDHIVQILGSTKAKFFDLTPHASNGRTIHIAETVGGKIYDPLSPTPPLSRATSLVSMQSLQDASQTDNLQPIASSLIRSLRLCTYFLGGFESFLSTGGTFDSTGVVDNECNIALKLSALKPYMVPFDSIECVLLDEDGNNSVAGGEIPYEEFNSCIVGLCGRDSRTCHGLGIVRSIDLRCRIFYIVTPVDGALLRSNVTTIVRGQLQLPVESTFCGEHSESFPFLSFDGASIGIGSDTMKSKSAFIKK